MRPRHVYGVLPTRSYTRTLKTETSSYTFSRAIVCKAIMFRFCNCLFDFIRQQMFVIHFRMKTWRWNTKIVIWQSLYRAVRLRHVYLHFQAWVDVCVSARAYTCAHHAVALQYRLPTDINSVYDTKICRFWKRDLFYFNDQNRYPCRLLVSTNVTYDCIFLCGHIRIICVHCLCKCGGLESEQNCIWFPFQ